MVYANTRNFLRRILNYGSLTIQPPSISASNPPEIKPVAPSVAGGAISIHRIEIEFDDIDQRDDVLDAIEELLVSMGEIGTLSSSSEIRGVAGGATPLSERDPHFVLRFMNDETVEGELDLDEFQLTLYPEHQRIAIGLSGNDLAKIRELPSLKDRISGGAAPHTDESRSLFDTSDAPERERP